MLLRLLGRVGDMNAIFDTMRITQSREDTVHWGLIEVTGSLFAPKGAPRLSGKGMYTPEPFADHVAAARVCFASEIDADGEETLNELEAIGGREWALSTMCHPEVSNATQVGCVYGSICSSVDMGSYFVITCNHWMNHITRKPLFHQPEMVVKSWVLLQLIPITRYSFFNRSSFMPRTLALAHAVTVIEFHVTVCAY